MPRNFKDVDGKELQKIYYEVDRAVKLYKLITQPCEICKSIEKIKAHHEDYDKPLDIMWLCTKCHTKYHKMKNKLSKNFSYKHSKEIILQELRKKHYKKIYDIPDWIYDL